MQGGSTDIQSTGPYTTAIVGWSQKITIKVHQPDHETRFHYSA